MGIPSALMGLVVWRLKFKIENKQREQDEKNGDQEKLVLILVKSSRASISLSEAIANAMKRGYANGDVENALRYAEKVKDEQKEYLEKKGIHAILEQ